MPAIRWIEVCTNFIRDEFLRSVFRTAVKVNRLTSGECTQYQFRDWNRLINFYWIKIANQFSTCFIKVANSSNTKRKRKRERARETKSVCLKRNLNNEIGRIHSCVLVARENRRVKLTIYCSFSLHKNNIGAFKSRDRLFGRYRQYCALSMYCLCNEISIGSKTIDVSDISQCECVPSKDYMTHT